MHRPHTARESHPVLAHRTGNRQRLGGRDRRGLRRQRQHLLDLPTTRAHACHRSKGVRHESSPSDGGGRSTRLAVISADPRTSSGVLCGDAHLRTSDAQRMAARPRRHLPEPRHGRGDAPAGAGASAGDHRRDRTPTGPVHAPRAGRHSRDGDRAAAPARGCRGGGRVRRSGRRGPDVRRQHHHRRQRRAALVPVRRRRRDRRDQPRLRRRRQRGDVRGPHDRRHAAHDRAPAARRRPGRLRRGHRRRARRPHTRCWSSTTSPPARRWCCRSPRSPRCATNAVCWCSPTARTCPATSPSTSTRSASIGTPPTCTSGRGRRAAPACCGQPSSTTAICTRP